MPDEPPPEQSSDRLAATREWPPAEYAERIAQALERIASGTPRPARRALEKFHEEIRDDVARRDSARAERRATIAIAVAVLSPIATIIGALIVSAGK